MNDSQEVNLAVKAARDALDSWSSRPIEDRIAVLNTFAEQLAQNKDNLREIICRETGKPRWSQPFEGGNWFWARPLVKAHPGSIRLQSSFTRALELLEDILLAQGSDTAAEQTAEEWARAALSGHEGDELERALITRCYTMLRVAVPLSAQLAARAARGVETDFPDLTAHRGRSQPGPLEREDAPVGRDLEATVARV